MRNDMVSLSQIIKDYMGEDKVWAASPNPAIIKKMIPAFTEYIIELGIAPCNFKTSNDKYSFSKDDVDFIKEFFQNYTSHKNRKIRSKTDVLSAGEIAQWLELIENTMLKNGKTREEIQIQKNKFYKEAKPDRGKMVDSIVDEIREMLMKFTDEVDKEQFALPTDKELVLQKMQSYTLSSVRDNIKLLSELLFYVHEVRTEDISDYGVASANDSQLAIYNEATFALNKLYRLDKCYREKMEALTELIERHHATDQPLRVRLMSEIEGRKKELCQQVAKRMELNSDKLWEHSQADELKTSEAIWLQFLEKS